ncbi:hypothetical protein BH11MYX4_BH11MYX4_50270 [soil metagenome]
MGVKRGATGSALGALVVLASLASGGRAQADSACIAAYEQTQTLRKDGRPVAAKAQASICARDACPALLTKDCNKWLAELEVIIPSVILDPRAPSGGLRADVRVKLDGVAVAERIDGKPLVVEPGSHTFTFEADGAVPVERTLVLREGDKNKKLTVTMAPAPAVAVVERPVPLGVWVFGGVAVAALATSAVFAIDGLGKKSDLDECKPRCAPDDVDAMSTRFTFADVALGAGVMAGAAAVYLLLTRPTVEVTHAAPGGTASTRPVPFATALPGGGAVGLGARF